MKKITKNLIFSFLAVLLGVGSIVGFNEFKSSHSETTAFSPYFKDKDKLFKKSDIVVKGFVPEKYTEVEAELPDEKGLYEISRVYEVRVEKTVKNKEGLKFKKDDVVELYVPIGFEQKKSGKFLPLVEQEKINFEEGEYLLFLNSTNSDLHGKEILQLTTPNHIYKKKNGKYENVATSLIPELEEDDLLDQ